MTIDAEEQFMTALSGVRSPEGKRKIIGREFIRAFEVLCEMCWRTVVLTNLAIDFPGSGHVVPRRGRIRRRCRNNQHQEPSQRWRAAADLKFKLVEPLRLLFKDEVRAVGRRARFA